MGAAATVVTQAQINKGTNDAYNSCGSPATAVNEADFKHVHYIQITEGCPPGAQGFNVVQKAATDATCLITNLQKNAASLAASLDSKAQAGLGIAVTDDSQIMESDLSNSVNNTCAGASSTNIANIEDTDITACNITLVQNATAKQSCIINNTQKVMSKMKGSVIAQASGMSWWGILLICLGILLVIGGGVLFYKFFWIPRKQRREKSEVIGEDETQTKKKKQNGGIWDFFSDINNPDTFTMKLKKNKSGMVLLVIIVVIFILFLIGFSKNNNKELTDDDINRFNQTVAEAQQIVRSPPPRYHSSPLQKALSDSVWSTTVSDIGPTNSPTHASSPTYKSPQYQNPYYGGQDEDDTGLDEFYKPLI